MRTSPAGLRFLEQQEGRALHVYLDAANIPTVGVGHVVRPWDGLKVGDTITEETCDRLLAQDVATTEAVITANVTAPLSQNAFDALVSLVYNIGLGAFKASTVLRDLNAGALDDVPRGWRLWNKVTRGGELVVDAGLAARREREIALFLTPDETLPSAA